jgi:hypothetical protein
VSDRCRKRAQEHGEVGLSGGLGGGAVEPRGARVVHANAAGHAILRAGESCAPLGDLIAAAGGLSQRLGAKRAFRGRIWASGELYRWGQRTRKHTETCKADGRPHFQRKRSANDRSFGA